MPLDIYLNVAVGFILHGLADGLRACLSVISAWCASSFRARAMMASQVSRGLLFAAFKLDPLIMLIPIAGCCSFRVCAARGLASLHYQPEHSQFR